MKRSRLPSNRNYYNEDGRGFAESPSIEKSLLTETQTEVWGRSNQRGSTEDVAEKLDMSANTVYVHLKNARDRLGAPDNEQAIKKASKLGLLS